MHTLAGKDGKHWISALVYCKEGCYFSAVGMKLVFLIITQCESDSVVAGAVQEASPLPGFLFCMPSDVGMSRLNWQD
jgi:hypothetical protein